MFTEDFQMDFLRQYHAVFDEFRGSFLAGEMAWNFADFMTGQGPPHLALSSCLISVLNHLAAWHLPGGPAGTTSRWTGKDGVEQGRGPRTVSCGGRSLFGYLRMDSRVPGYAILLMGPVMFLTIVYCLILLLYSNFNTILYVFLVFSFMPILTVFHVYAIFVNSALIFYILIGAL